MSIMLMMMILGVIMLFDSLPILLNTKYVYEVCVFFFDKANNKLNLIDMSFFNNHVEIQSIKDEITNFQTTILTSSHSLITPLKNIFGGTSLKQKYIKYLVKYNQLLNNNIKNIKLLKINEDDYENEYKIIKNKYLKLKNK